MDAAAAAPAVPAWDAWLHGSLASLHERHLFRTLRPVVPGASAVEVRVAAADLAAWLAGAPAPAPGGPARRSGGGGAPAYRTVKLFSLNDYLGLATHPAVRRAAAAAAAAAGAGPRASPLVAGYTAAHRELEAALAALAGAEDCLLFPSGYAANSAALAAAAGNPDTTIFSDALNHASIVDGCRLAAARGAAVRVYRHNDVGHLEALLASAPPRGRRLVVTDGLFSMDGGAADLAALAAARARWGFLLMVDEAHATGVMGARGGGAAEAAGAAAAVDLHVGTLSKALGSSGGFVACSAPWRALLANAARAQVFSTALPGPAVAAAAAALRLATRDEPWRAPRVRRLAARLAAGLAAAGLGPGAAGSPIVPVVLGGEAAAVAASAALLGRGFHVPAIRPPTVPRGTARLRASLSAAHADADVDALCGAVVEAVGRAGGGAGGGRWPAARL